MRVQILIWFQTFLLFKKSHDQTINELLKDISFQAFQIISDFFRHCLTDALTPLLFLNEYILYIYILIQLKFISTKQG